MPACKAESPSSKIVSEQSKAVHGKLVVPPYPCLARLEEHLLLTSRAKATRDEYMRYARRIALWAGRDPEALTEEDLRAFFIHLKTKANYAPNTIRLVTAALRFLFVTVLERKDWKVLELISSPSPLRLPLALRADEVRRLLEVVRDARMRLTFALLYGCGLRVGEVVKLEVRDVRGRGEPLQRLHIREAKGGKDRMVPLPPTLYRQLRALWETHRHPRFLFPSKGWTHKARGDGAGRAPEFAQAHVSVSAVQHCMGLARREARLPEGVTCHTLRHSYATHALDAGVNLKQLSLYLGHHDISVTAVYLHLSTLNEARAMAAIESFSAPVVTW